MALRDMEELVAQIVRADARDYMAEALRCYNAEAFRACVVLSYIAVFDDLREKLVPLTKVNSKAKTIHQDIEKKAKNQEVFESDLANQLASTGLIDAGQKTKLETFIQLRNKAAHPSRIHASAEQARFVFSEVIEHFLSKKTLQTMHVADAIIASLSQGNYFPSNQLNDIRSVVEQDLALLHDQAAPYLIHKLIELRQNGDAATKAAVRSFFLGLADMKKPVFFKEIQKEIVIGKGQDKDFATLIVSLIRVDPKLAENLTAVAQQRIVALLKVVVADATPGKTNRLANPVGWLKAFVDLHGQEKVWKDYQPVVEALIEKYMFDPGLMAIVGDEGIIHDAFFKAFEDQASSGTFAIANPAAKALGSLDDTVGDQLTTTRAFRIITAVTRAAEGHAFDAQAIRDAKFKVAPHLRKKAYRVATKTPVKAGKILDEFHVMTSLQDLETLLA
jgi:hypothetical protein